MTATACEPCSRDDCDNCRVVGCVCCGDAQPDLPDPMDETCCSLGACDQSTNDDWWWAE